MGFGGSGPRAAPAVPTKDDTAEAATAARLRAARRRGRSTTILTTEAERLISRTTGGRGGRTALGGQGARL